MQGDPERERGAVTAACRPENLRVGSNPTLVHPFSSGKVHRVNGQLSASPPEGGMDSLEQNVIRVQLEFLRDRLESDLNFLNLRN